MASKPVILRVDCTSQGLLRQRHTLPRASPKLLPLQVTSFHETVCFSLENEVAAVMPKHAPAALCQH